MSGALMACAGVIASSSVTNDYIATPTATPAAFGDALEGGFYAGMIWNEVIQSATSTTIGTGSMVFTVASMTAVPLFYSGQTVEVRSRANPSNKMIGTVTGALGTSLTITVSSVGGSGTLSDWSIMSRYRVIVSPKASGENLSIALKNVNSALPAGCFTLVEGKKATDAMVAGGTSTVYPAAWWCHNLSISDHTDWYLPARDELELLWRNLKPTADNNYTTADRAAAQATSYLSLGTANDTSAANGLNNNSIPAGAAYTTGSPAQVSAGKNFRTGESEALEYTAGTHSFSSSSDYTGTLIQGLYINPTNVGYQGSYSKTTLRYIRAVRRSII